MSKSDNEARGSGHFRVGHFATVYRPPAKAGARARVIVGDFSIPVRQREATAGHYLPSFRNEKKRSGT